MTSSLVTSFLGALQAALSVLLTISYGIIAAQFNILNKESSKVISKLCVHLFLPALLVTNIGSKIHVDNVLQYLSVLGK
jgi:auxin efflux carrier family protein